LEIRNWNQNLNQKFESKPKSYTWLPLQNAVWNHVGVRARSEIRANSPVKSRRRDLAGETTSQRRERVSTSERWAGPSSEHVGESVWVKRSRDNVERAKPWERGRERWAERIVKVWAQLPTLDYYKIQWLWFAYVWCIKKSLCTITFAMESMLSIW